MRVSGLAVRHQPEVAAGRTSDGGDRPTQGVGDRESSVGIADAEDPRNLGARQDHPVHGMPGTHDIDSVKNRKPLSAKEFQRSQIDDQAAGVLQSSFGGFAEGECIGRVDLTFGRDEHDRRAND